MSKQVIAAELHRDEAGQVDRIIFDGCWFQLATDHDFTYPHRFPNPGPEDPTRLFCDRRCPAWQEEWTYESPWGAGPAEVTVTYGTVLPPELLTPDPDLMASPEGDVKGLQELQDAARAQMGALNETPG